VLWLVTGGLAYRAARRRDFTVHRDWMLRNYALTFLAVTARVLVPLLLLVQLPFSAGDAASIGERAPSMIPIGQTAGWIINLVVAESIIRRRRRRPGRESGPGHPARRVGAYRRPDGDAGRTASARGGEL
jgi:hypothetical protein